MIKKKISKAVINRLPRYYRYLGDLLNHGVERISSEELSQKMGLTASQIRQDFNNFGGFGQQGYGYKVDNLKDEIGKILGIDRKHTLAIVGTGNIGTALANSYEFATKGFPVVALFDSAPDVIGKEINGIKIQDVKELESVVADNNIDIVAICVPRDYAREVAESAVKGGVKGIWNFAHIDLNVPKNVVLENVHLADILMQISYSITEKED